MLTKVKNVLGISLKRFLIIAAGAAILAFGIVNIHSLSRITEGGVLGLSLFLKQMLGVKQSISAPILDILCFIFAVSVIGKKFLKISVIASLTYAMFLKLFEFTGPLLPSFYEYPLIAALLGGVFVGIGCSLVMSQGAASGGDDALAMGISKKSKMRLSHVFFITDAIVLGLSLMYIPVHRIVWSFLTTFVSSGIIGQFEIHFPVTAANSARKAKTESV